MGQPFRVLLKAGLMVFKWRRADADCCRVRTPHSLGVAILLWSSSPSGAAGGRPPLLGSPHVRLEAPPGLRANTCMLPPSGGMPSRAAPGSAPAQAHRTRRDVRGTCVSSVAA